VASAGPYATHLHLTEDRHSRLHLITQFFTSRVLFLTPNQQCQSNEGTNRLNETSTKTTFKLARKPSLEVAPIKLPPFSSRDRELWPMTLTMTLEYRLDSVKLKQRIKFLGQTVKGHLVLKSLSGHRKDIHWTDWSIWTTKVVGKITMQSFYYLRQGRHVTVVVFCLSVCLTVTNFAQKLPNRFAWNFHGRMAMGQWTNDYILVAIRITVPHPYHDIGKTCLGGDMHCPSASSYMHVLFTAC